MKALLSALILCAAVLAPLPAPADGAPSIVPPAGWSPKPVPESTGSPRMLGIWLAPPTGDGYNDNMTLLREDAATAFDDYVAASRSGLLKSLTKTLDTDADEACADGKAHRFAYVSTFGTVQVEITQLLRLAGGNAYIVTYARKADRPADAAALAALRTLCTDAPV